MDTTIVLDYLGKNYQVFLMRNETRYFTKEIQEKFKNTSFTFGFRIVIFIIICYFVIKLLVSFLGFLYFRKESSQYDNHIYQKNKNSANSILKKEKGDSTIKLKFLTYRIYSIMSFRKAHRYLIAVKNFYYNDRETEKFLFMKYIALFGINFFILILNFVGRAFDLSEINFSYQRYMYLFKLTYYCYNLYMLMAGFFFSYKLLTYISANKDTSLKSFFKFYSISFTRFFLFYFSALVVIYYSKEIYNYFGNYNITDDPYIGMNKSTFNCYVQPQHLLIPFFINYYNPSMYKQYLITAQCNSVFLLFSTEFYIFTFSTTLFYFIYKYKSKFFEIFICILPFLFLLFLLKYWSFEGMYTNREIIFAVRKVLKPHSLFVPYFFGIIVGIIYFVNNYTEVLLHEATYLPFKFFSSINVFLHRRSVMTLKIFSYLFIILAVLVSFNFNLIVYLYSNGEQWNNENVFQVKFDVFLNIIYLYEHKIFVMFIGFYLILLIHRMNHDEDSSFFFFLPISRSTYCILLSSDLVSGLIYMKILSWTKEYTNTITICTFGVSAFLLTIIIGIAMHITLESPFRFVLKKFFSKEKKKN